MKIHRNEIPEATVTKGGRRRRIRLTSVDLVLSTPEISELIQDLEQLKREGRSKTGYHIHLDDDESRETNRIQVSLFHEKTYAPHCFSATVWLDNK